MSQVVNVSGYKFVSLSELESIQSLLRDASNQHALKGTILLSREGINCFVAGSREGIDGFLEVLRSIAGLEDFEAKESLNSYQPFSRMLVKIKKEIIAFDPEFQLPSDRPAKKLSPIELRKWLDDNRELVLLDTRNDYEIALGTFENAESVSIDQFREFPAAVHQLPEEYRQKTIVMFCTGGIRCEKAGPFMEREGFENVFQLDGGILKYFEECGGAHWQGECFVFDKRVALDPQASETATTLCYVCQALIDEKDQCHPHYQFGVSCPKCFEQVDEVQTAVLDPEQRNLQLANIVTPLPGSVPYENFRPMTVAKDMDGLPLLDFLEALRTHLTREQWIQFVDAGQILHKGKPVGAERIVMHGQKYYHLLPDTIEPDVSSDLRILYEDQDIIAIEKPAPLPMHPCGRFNKNTLQSFLHELYSPDRLRLVHRLDANTTGIVIYARSKPVATLIQDQFAQGKVEKEYFAGVIGIPGESTFRSEKKIARRPGAGGIRFLDSSGQMACTEFEVLGHGESDRGPTSLLLARPRTGRTNQIRLHLWDLGFPVCGDPTYLPGLKTGVNQTKSIDDPPLQLHASRIGFQHPTSEKWVEFTAEPPSWVQHFHAEGARK